MGADEEDDPSDVMHESTFETEHAHDLSLICTPPPTSLVGNHVYPHSLDDSLVPSQLPRMQTTLRRTDIAESLSSLSAVSPTLHVNPACHQLTLADLHEGSRTPIPGTNQRHTIFLPHPNAPKSPPTKTRGLSVHYVSTTFFTPWWYKYCNSGSNVEDCNAFTCFEAKDNVDKTWEVWCWAGYGTRTCVDHVFDRATLSDIFAASCGASAS